MQIYIYIYTHIYIYISIYLSLQAYMHTFRDVMSVRPRHVTYNHMDPLREVDVNVG